MRTSGFLRAMILGLVVAGCGSDPAPSFTPEDADFEAGTEDASVDDTPSPSFDVPELDNPQPPDITPPRDTTTPTDNVSTADRSSPPDTSSADRSLPGDGSGGVCPASCRMDTDCDPCRMAGDPGNYCCISGLCLYMTGACMAPTPDGGGPGSPDGGDGGGPADAGDAGDGGG